MNNNQQNNNNKVIRYQKVSDQYREQIIRNYFFGNKQYSQWCNCFNRYMGQQYEENQDQQVIKILFLFENQDIRSTQIQSEIIAQHNFPLNYNIYYLIGSLCNLKYYLEDQQEQQFQVCDLINNYFDSFHFEISLPCVLNEDHFETLKQQFQNPSLINKFKKKMQQLNDNNIIFRDVSSQASYLIIENVVKLNQSNQFAFQQNNQRLIRSFSIKIDNQYAKISIENLDFDAVQYPDNKRQYTKDEQSTDNSDEIQITEYNVIMDQLKCEQEEWTLNLINTDYTFYKKVDKYPEFFYLRPQQALTTTCKKGYVRISYIPI